MSSERCFLLIYLMLFDSSRMRHSSGKPMNRFCSLSYLTCTLCLKLVGGLILRSVLEPPLLLTKDDDAELFD